MKGTEKQIAWAEDLKESAIATLEWMRENPSKDGQKNLEMWNKGVDYQEAKINAVESAGKLIDALRDVSFSKGPEKCAISLISAVNRCL